ncbi:pentatricopeptide repeat-containing protein, chloroplastic [Iris pallida]|uniref:Pentatricopeptide repeat-containing protein, chloroplastic n=1 Tax=Iris pallida TaxID=29817 RepID=A0AAX6G4V5_IRIPA|nr:pentatricopeptide repeat-containing protein, chloroplastic [Iris pallida]
MALCVSSSSAKPQEMAPYLSSTSLASPPVTVVSKCAVYPDRKSTMGDLKLSVSDLPMLSCHYIQKGLFFPPPAVPGHSVVSLLKDPLARALSFFPPLAGRLHTDHDGRIYVSCNDAGVEFAHAVAPALSLPLLLPEGGADVPCAVRSLFALDGVVSYQGHCRPLAAFQVTELGDGAVFVGCSVNHAVADGTSFWNFFNAWAELSRAAAAGAPDAPLLALSRPPDFRRSFFGESEAVLQFPEGKEPEVTFPVNAPLRERIFHFSLEAIRELKSRANDKSKTKTTEETEEEEEEVVSSFQSLCAQLWISVTRARKQQLVAGQATTFRMAVNCRHRVVPRVDGLYFGNAIQSIPTTVRVEQVLSRGLPWAARLLHRGVVGHGDARVREGVSAWEGAPRCFPLGNPDGAGVTMGSSPRFPMYEGNDFGWGPPVAVRSGRANKFDGKISAFPGRSGGGSVELEVCLAPEAMAGLLQDEEFMYYVSLSD